MVSAGFLAHAVASALCRGFGWLPPCLPLAALAVLVALAALIVPAALVVPTHCCLGYSRTSLPSLCGHSTEENPGNQRSRLGSVTSNAGDPHNLNARTPAHTTATTTERRDNGVRTVASALRRGLGESAPAAGFPRQSPAASSRNLWLQLPPALEQNAQSAVHAPIGAFINAQSAVRAPTDPHALGGKRSSPHNR